MHAWFVPATRIRSHRRNMGITANNPVHFMLADSTGVMRLLCTCLARDLLAYVACLKLHPFACKLNMADAGFDSRCTSTF